MPKLKQEKISAVNSYWGEKKKLVDLNREAVDVADVPLSLLIIHLWRELEGGTRKGRLKNYKKKYRSDHETLNRILLRII